MLLRYVRLYEEPRVGVLLRYVRLYEEPRVGVLLRYVRLYEEPRVGVLLRCVRLYEEPRVGVLLRYVRLYEEPRVGVLLRYVHLYEEPRVGVLLRYVRLFQILLTTDHTSSSKYIGHFHHTTSTVLQVVNKNRTVRVCQGKNYIVQNKQLKGKLKEKNICHNYHIYYYCYS